MTARQPERIVAILGMHRSGTSCLTGSLQKGGLVLGKYHTFNEYNRKGNRENEDIVNLHEGLLRENGGGWDNPPTTTHWTERHRERASGILATWAHEPLWGFKDPRTLLFIDGWLALAPHSELIGIYRHPLVVARSLHSRKALPISIEQGLNLWRNYNAHLLIQLRRQQFPLLCFDWSEEIFHDKLAAVHQMLGLRALPPDARFYTGDLHKHHLEDDAVALPDDIQQMYDELHHFCL